jgi:hypothetical protein
MTTVDAAGVGDEEVAMVATAEIDMIIEVVVAADMGFRLDRLDLWDLLRLIWDMAMAQATQSADMGHHLLLPHLSHL